MVRLFAGLLLFSTTIPATATSMCGEPDAILPAPGKLDVPEQVAFEGTMTGGAKLRVYLNPEHGTWTVIVFNDVQACITAAGKDGEVKSVHVTGDPT